jgi:4-diphosphocytidyl-2C-methyl-D-erythritol kinase
VTGSGPTIFGVFATRDEAERAADAVSEEISGPSPIVVGLRG